MRGGGRGRRSYPAARGRGGDFGRRRPDRDPPRRHARPRSDQRAPARRCRRADPRSRGHPGRSRQATSPRPPVEAPRRRPRQLRHSHRAPRPRANTAAPAARASARATVPRAPLSTRESERGDPAPPADTRGRLRHLSPLARARVRATRPRARRGELWYVVTTLDGRCVDLRGRDVHVAEHGLHRAQIGAAPSRWLAKEWRRVAGARVEARGRGAGSDPEACRDMAPPERLRKSAGHSRRTWRGRIVERYRRTQSRARAPAGTRRCRSPFPITIT
jgi:hypothetical protein